MFLDHIKISKKYNYKILYVLYGIVFYFAYIIAGHMVETIQVEMLAGN